MAADFKSELVEAMFAHKAGNYVAAIKIYRRILDQEPRHADALHHFGMAMAKLGRTADAIRLMEASLVVSPDQAGPHLNLARLLLASGELERASRHAETAISLDDHDPQGFILRGHCQKALKRFDRAAEAYERAAEIDPGNVDVIKRLAETLSQLGRTEEAVEWFEYALGGGSEDARLAESYGLALRKMGQGQKALEVLSRALEHAPDDLALVQNRAAMLEEEGDFSAAAEGYRHALALDPENAQALGSLIRQPSFAGEEAWVAKAEAVVGTADRTAADRVFVGYGLGRYYDRVSEFSAAFRCYDAANKLQATESVYDPGLFDAFVAESVVAFPGNAEAKAERASSEQSPPNLVFIIGMPRSGTTLTEQILSSHSAVGGCGEVDFFVNAFGLWNSAPNNYGWPKTLANLDENLVEKARSDYLSKLGQIDSVNRVRTDKMPFNFLYVGFIRRLFPTAKFINCARHPLDVCLSSYFENLSRDFSFSMAQDRLAYFYRGYRRLTDHWKSAYGDAILTFPYERLLERPKYQVRTLLDFCGLPWEDACLDFHKTARAVRTPSNWQVRQPLYTSSRGRWRNYEAHIGLLLDALSEEVEAYEERLAENASGSIPASVS
ncbi:MAG: sulfotransferase [Pseudomonadota bacterium]